MCTTSLIASLIFVVLLINAPTMAQRPSYAGSRPTGGLSQKEKYHTQRPAIENPSGGVNNRFGAPDNNQSVLSNSIPYGAPQRPPIGWPIVTPQAQYVPLNNNVNPQTQPQFSLDNRISGNDIGGGSAAANGVFSSAGAAANSNAGGNFAAQQPQGFQNLPPPPFVSGLPLDAHGDQALIDYLNTVPLDQRPFWFLNYQAIEAQRNSSKPTFTGAVGARGSFFG